MTEKAKGRPQGAKNITERQIVQTPTCPRCGCTDRDAYRLVSSLDYPGTTAAGLKYTHVIARRTRCLNCDTTRIDKFFENKAPNADPGQENEPT